MKQSWIVLAALVYWMSGTTTPALAAECPDKRMVAIDSPELVNACLTTIDEIEAWKSAWGFSREYQPSFVVIVSDKKIQQTGITLSPLELNTAISLPWNAFFGKNGYEKVASASYLNLDTGEFFITRLARKDGSVLNLDAPSIRWSLASHFLTLWNEEFSRRQVALEREISAFRSDPNSKNLEQMQDLLARKQGLVQERSRADKILSLVKAVEAVEAKYRSLLLQKLSLKATGMAESL